MPDNASTLAHPLDDADADTLRAVARALPTTIALCARAVADGLDLPPGWTYGLGITGRVRLTGPDGRNTYVWPDNERGDDWDHTGSVSGVYSKTGRHPTPQAAAVAAIAAVLGS